MTTKNCGACKFELKEEFVLDHVEMFHVGPRPLGEITIRCQAQPSECSFQVSGHRIAEMIKHVSCTGHDVGKVSVSWRNFCQRETERILQILEEGSKISASDSSNTAIECANSARETNIKKENQSKQESSALKQTKRPKTTGTTSGPEKKPPKKRKISEQSSSVPSDRIKPPEKLEISPVKNYSNAKKLLTETPRMKGVTDVSVKSEPEASDQPISTVRPEHTVKQQEKPPVKRGNTTAGIPPPNKIAPDPYDADLDWNRTAYDCKLCHHSIKKINFKYINRFAIIHMFTHDKAQDLYPFKCANCPAVGLSSSYLKKHAKNSKLGCTGKSTNNITPEKIETIFQTLNDTFPELEWRKRLIPGLAIQGIQF